MADRGDGVSASWVRLQLSVSAGSEWPHNALRHHWLMSISCHLRDCKALLVTSMTHVSGAITSVQTFTLHSLLLFQLRFFSVCQTEAEALCSYVVCLSTICSAAHRRISQTRASQRLRPSRRLRSSGAITCVIPSSRTHLGDRSFDVA